MNKKKKAVPLLDEAHADFIQHHVAINVASCDADNMPTLARALGCRVSQDRQRVTVFLAASRSETLLNCLRARRRIAVVCSRPSTHQTLQLKGSDAAIVPVDESDHVLIAAYCESIVTELRNIGFLENYIRAVFSAPGDDVVAVAFTPDAAFVATPGPGAGQRLPA